MTHLQRFSHIGRLIFFFLIGAFTTALVLASLSYLGFSFYFQNRIYPGVKVAGVDLSRQTKNEAQKALTQLKTSPIDSVLLTFSAEKASISATTKDLQVGLDTDLMVKRAYSIGRQTKNPYWNFQQILAAWQGTINLPIEVIIDDIKLNFLLDKVAPDIEKKPIDATFKFQPGAGPDGRGRVIAFTKSADGLAIDREKTKEELILQAKKLLTNPSIPHQVPIPIVTSIVSPAIQSSTADKMGIKDLLGEGQSYFYDSIPGRVFNIGLGTEKVSGSLIAPNEVFSFSQAIGTVSGVFGFAKAYVIKEGKTVLDDGGGVCQVSTTLYRAVLNSGLPVVERAPHTYRVGFYEQGGFLPGLDATVFPPSPDFKFKNDTGHNLLVQANFDIASAKLTFDIFGTSDGRKTTILGPYFLSTSPPPEPIYQDDPTLPVGQTRQTDTAHAGAKVYFKRSVTRNSESLINETVYSDYIPWPARFLRGSKT